MMNAQHLKSCRPRISHRLAAVFLTACLAGLYGERAEAAAVQGVFTCPLDGESSRIAISLPGGPQKFPVRGRIGFDLQNAGARIFEIGFSTAPVLFHRRTAALEFALDPSLPAVTKVSPFISHFWVPASLLFADGSAAAPAHLEARLEVRFGPKLTGLVSGYLPGSTPTSRGPGFVLPVSCMPVPVQELTSELGITSYGSYAGATVGGQTAVVNVMNGNLVVDPVDLAITGRGVSLVLQRTFNGKDAGSGVFGKGWSSLLDVSLRDCTFACPVDTPPLTEFLFRDATGATWSFDADPPAVARGLRARLVNDSTIVYDDGTVLRLQSFESGTYRLFSITERNGNRLTIERNADGHPVKIVDSLGREVVLGLEAGRVKTISPPAGLAEVSYGYDGLGRLTTVTRAGETTTYWYDASDRMILSKDPRGFQTRFSYDFCFPGEETSIRYAREPGDSPASFDTYTTCVREGEATAKDPNGHVTTYFWDSTIDPSPTTIIDPLGRETELVYNIEFFTLERLTRDLSQHDWFYDFYGRLEETKLTFAGGTAPLVTMFEYFDVDPKGRYCNPAASPSCLRQYLVKRVVNTEGNETGLSYDDRGNLTSVTDSLGHVTSMTFNADGTLDTLVRPRGGFSFDYIYGASGTLDELTMTDPLGRVTRKVFDVAGRLAKVITADGKSTTFASDALDRLNAVTYADGSRVELAYDGNGNLVEMVDGTGTSRFKIDHRGRRIEDQASDGTSVTYAYDGVGNLTSKTDARGTTAFGYDAGDRLVSLVQPDGQEVKYCYEMTKSLERMVATYPDTLKIVRTLDGAGRLTQVRATAAGVEPGLGLPRENVLVDLTYTYAAPGPIESALLHRIVDALGITTDYGYDELGRLTSATTDSSRGIGHWAWTYDANGNRSRQVLGPAARQTVTTYAYDDADQLMSAGEPLPGSGPDPEPDPFPNPLQRLAYEWNDRGDLVERSNGLAIEYNDAVQTVAITPGSGKDPVAFTYRGLDQTQRLSMQQGADAGTRFTYDLTGIGPAGIEPEEAGAASSSIIRTPGGELVSLQRDGSTLYFVTDRLGSVVAVLDTVTVVEFGKPGPPRKEVRVFNRYEYDPWGNVLSAAGSEVRQQPFRFAGAELDAQTGLYKMGTRYYDPEIGRFTQPDPIGGGYAYAANDPVNLIDPSGYVAEFLPCVRQTDTLDENVAGSPFSGNDWTFKSVSTFTGPSPSAANVLSQVGSMVFDFASFLFPILKGFKLVKDIVGGAMFVTSVIETAGEGGDGTVEIFLRDPVRFHGVATYGNCGPMGVKVTVR